MFPMSEIYPRFIDDDLYLHRCGTNIMTSSLRSNNTVLDKQS